MKQLCSYEISHPYLHSQWDSVAWTCVSLSSLLVRTRVPLSRHCNFWQEWKAALPANSWNGMPFLTSSTAIPFVYPMRSGGLAGCYRKYDYIHHQEVYVLLGLVAGVWCMYRVAHFSHIAANLHTPTTPLPVKTFLKSFCSFCGSV